MMSKFKRIKASKASINCRKLVQGIGVNDSKHTANIIIKGKRITCPIYKLWSSILERCYKKNYHLKHPTYKDCSISSDWLIFSTFYKWAEPRHKEGHHLDKDILNVGNKVYSPKTCIFVTPQLNGLLVNCTTTKGNFLLGVSRSKKDRKGYLAQCSIGEGFSIKKQFPTEIEAHEFYVKTKIKRIRRSGLIDGRPEVIEGLERHINNLLTNLNIQKASKKKTANKLNIKARNYKGVSKVLPTPSPLSQQAIKVLIMKNNYTTPTNQPKKVALKSLFNLVLSKNSNRTVICKGLSGDQATSLVSILVDELGAPIVIKFARMEG